MAKVIGIDYGTKRVGIAISDELAMIATPLESVHSAKFDEYLTKILARGDISAIVIGLPVGLRGEDTNATEKVRQVAVHLRRLFPSIEVHFEDERFTSKIAGRTMIDAGLSRKKRGEKGMTDKISAAILLQSFLDGKKFQKGNSK